MSEALMAEPADSGVIVFEEGIIGVPRARRFQLLERQDSPIRVLRCLDVPHFALPVVDPQLPDPSYAPRLSPRVLEAIRFEPSEDLLLLAVTKLDAGGPLANLRAPLVINVGKRLGTQVILEDRKQPLRASFEVRTG